MTNHISCLDGIRGSLAMWVFWGHICNTVGAHIPLLETPAMAVDLFMLLSGFLMAYHWQLQANEPASYSSRVKSFWIRRFFRIAPLYYVLLIISLVATPLWAEAGRNLASAFPPQWAGDVVTHRDEMLSFPNVLSHITFIFGAIPRFASNNALPDWSLSLEMQFYLLFPFLMVCARPSRILFLVAVAISASVLMLKLFGLYLTIGPFGNFPQPSFLPFKGHVFASGMALSSLSFLRADQINSRIVYFVAFVLPLLFLSKYVALISLLIAALVLLKRSAIMILSNLLSCRAFVFLGDISYAVYLVHLIPLYLLLNQLLHWDYFVGAGAIVRFLIALTTISPVVCALAFGFHKAIELPGIKLGKVLAAQKDV